MRLFAAEGAVAVGAARRTDRVEALAAALRAEGLRAHAVPWWGRRVELRSAGMVVRGVAEGVDSAGALLLRLEDGSLKAVLSGEVTTVRLETSGGR